jgi:hypothetical protein
VSGDIIKKSSNLYGLSLTKFWALTSPNKVKTPNSIRKIEALRDFIIL